MFWITISIRVIIQSIYIREEDILLGKRSKMHNYKYGKWYEWCKSSLRS